MDVDGVNKNKHNANDGLKDQTDDQVDELFRIRFYFLQFAQGFSAALVFKIFV